MTFQATVKFATTGLLFIVALGFAMVAGGFIPWFLFYVFLALLIYLFLTKFLVFRGLTLNRTLSATRLSAGETLDVDEVFCRRGFWPLLSVRVQHGLPELWSFQIGSLRFSPFKPWESCIQLSYKVVGVERGIYKVPDTTLMTTDIFGFVKVKRVLTTSHRLIVYPRIVPVSAEFDCLSVTADGRQSTNRFHVDSTNVIGVREYTRGDRLNQIHWQLTARTGRLMTKEYELNVTERFFFIPDLTYASYQRLPKSSFELSMVILASLMNRVVSQGKSFEAAFQGKEFIFVPESTRESAFERSLELMAAASPVSSIDFKVAYERLTQDVRSGTTVVVVSPNLSGSMIHSLARGKRGVFTEWFVPTSRSLTEDEVANLKRLKNSGVRVHVIERAEQLSNAEKKR